MRAKEPFIFHTSSQLVEITDKKASNLKELVDVLKVIEDSSIFYHVHHAFREFHFAPGLYNNDFSRWVSEELGEASLAERLGSINIKSFVDLDSIRKCLVGMIEEHLAKNEHLRAARRGNEFFFCKNIGVIMKTNFEAWDLAEFCDQLRRVGLRSLFFHFFEATLRLHKKTNDFSDWIKTNFGKAQLAKKIEAIDPYSYSMDQLADRIISLIEPDTGLLLPYERLMRWLRLR